MPGGCRVIVMLPDPNPDITRTRDPAQPGQPVPDTTSSSFGTYAVHSGTNAVYGSHISLPTYLVSGLGRGRVRNLVPDPTPVHNPYPSDSGRVSARVWVGSQGKNLIYSI